MIDKDWDRLRERYMRDPLPVRLGNLVSSLTHLSTSGGMRSQHDYVPRMISECKHFIERTGREADLPYVEGLHNLQVKLAGRQLHWETLRNDLEATERVAAETRASSDQVLQWSGLLDE